MAPSLLSTTSLVLCSAGVIYALTVVNQYLAVRRMYKNIPARVTLLSRSNPLTLFFFPYKWLVYDRHRTWIEKHRSYEETGSEAIVNITLFPVSAELLVADAETIKNVSYNRAKWPKAVFQYEVLSFYGKNVVASEGEEWKKMRKISAPAFSEKNFQMVWDETLKVMDEYFDEWEGKNVVVLDHFLDMTLALALQVIGSAGFGKTYRDTTIPLGHKMTFRQAFQLVARGVFVKLLTGNWFPGVTKRIRDVRAGSHELQRYLGEIIEDRRAGKVTERGNDLFSNLFAENEDESRALTDSELMGNIFIFVLAGHETSAMTMCFTFMMLALYQEEQEKVYEQIKSLYPKDGSPPTYQDMMLYTRVMASYYETLRLFPPVSNIPKESGSDQVLTFTQPGGDNVSIPLAEGTPVMLDVCGLHYDPRYWDEPYEFRPDRFIGQYNKDAFIPFASGVRACMGRKFFETEGVCVLVQVLSKFKVTIKEEPRFAGETFEQRKERITRSKPILTLTPERVPLVFTRR